jgi:hypothetical protein
MWGVSKPFVRNASKCRQVMTNMVDFSHEVEPICETIGDQLQHSTSLVA